MKNLIFLPFLAIILVSCKKDRVCNCYITTTGTTTTNASVSLSLGGFPIPIADTSFTSPLFTQDQNKITYTKVKKKTARNNCLSRSENINETNPTIIPGFLNVTVNNKGTRVYDCKLE